MSVKRKQHYHIAKVKQAEQKLFDGFWKQVLQQKKGQGAIFSDDGSVLRTFQAIEEERGLWRDRLSGFSIGDCVVAPIGNEGSWPGFLLACWDESLVVVPVEPEMQTTQLDRILQLTQAQGVVQANCIQRLDSTPIRWTGPRPDLLKITSGTTGAPRAVRFRQSHLLADCQNICESMRIRPDDVNFGVIPFAHSYGFSNLVTPLIYQGTGLVCSTDRVPRAVCKHLYSSGASIFPGTPALFQALGSLPDSDIPPTVRLCISAGAPLVPEISREFYRRFGRKIHSFYGSSECGGIAYDRNEECEPTPGFVGTPMNGVEVTRFDQNRIAVSGPNVADGYFPEQDVTMLDGRRFVPGDIVEWSESGLRLIGRVSDIVNIAGKKIHPSIVEEHIRKLAGVTDTIVFGIPSATRNEDLIAYVVGSNALTRQMLENHCREGLDAWQVPREFQIVPALPFNQRGKINRGELSKIHIESRRNRESSETDLLRNLGVE
jgi:long-chain acyl-CoA synthetase